MNSPKVLMFLFLLALSLAVNLNKPFPGHFTYCNDAGCGACGTQINATSEKLVAVGPFLLDEANPNKDPLCSLCLKVEYKRTRVPIKDKCPSCDSNHIDLSLPAFKELENPNVGYAHGATFTFVSCWCE